MKDLIYDRRKGSLNRTVYKRYVLDDGWNLPKEVVEAIDLAIIQSRQSAYRQIKEQHDRHRGDYITEEIASLYEAKSWPYRVLYDYQYIKEVRQMGKELQERYGVTELEAQNILNGVHTKEYVAKYHRIKHLIPNKVDEQRVCDRIVSKYLSQAV